MKEIYLDNSATTQGYKEVVEVMKDCLLTDYGNPSSTHYFGEKSKELMNNARKLLAEEINCKASEIIFTSGATESNNLAILGLASKTKNRNKIIISSLEHSSIYEPCMHLKRKGFEIVEIEVDSDGIIDLDKLEREIDSKTLLVSIIHVQNEIGVVQDIERIGKICNLNRVLFHVDAAQSFGKVEINVAKCNISLLSASAHKIHGPKGIGFLYLKNGIDIEPIIYGAGQEKGLRSGTENLPGILGFAKALELIRKVDKRKIRDLRDYLIEELEKMNGKINGSLKNRIYNNVNVIFQGDAEMIISRLSTKGIMVSTKSACSSSKHDNRVLKALGLNNKEISGSLRIVLSQFTSKKDIDYTLREMNKIVKYFR